MKRFSVVLFSLFFWCGVCSASASASVFTPVETSGGSVFSLSDTSGVSVWYLKADIWSFFSLETENSVKVEFDKKFFWYLGKGKAGLVREYSYGSVLPDGYTSFSTGLGCRFGFEKFEVEASAGLYNMRFYERDTKLYISGLSFSLKPQYVADKSFRVGLPLTFLYMRGLTGFRAGLDCTLTFSR